MQPPVLATLDLLAGVALGLLVAPAARPRPRSRLQAVLCGLAIAAAFVLVAVTLAAWLVPKESR